MKSYGLVIDESLQPPKPFHTPHQTSNSALFPKRPQLDPTTESYSTVVEQAITTKDRPLLKEIIADSDSKIRRNTVSSMAVEKVPALLSLLQQFLYDDSRNTDHYCAWLKELIRQHLGLILSSPDNRPVISRLLRFVQKRVEDRPALLQMRGSLQGQGKYVKTKEFKPKFSYIQNQEKQGEEGVESGQMEQQEMQLDDDMLDEFDQ